jgi:hypothetical protein
MSTKERTANGENGHRVDGGNDKIWLYRGALIALIAAVVTVTTTVVLIGGSEPANAGFLGIPCW